MIGYHIIASQTSKGIIGVSNSLYCQCRDDLRRFYKITTDVYPESKGSAQNMLIMGYNTWMSIPDSVRPFTKRMSIVISNNHVVSQSENVVQVHSLQKAFHYCAHNQTGRIFVIGGSQVFRQCADMYPTFCENLYITHFETQTNMDEYTQVHLFPSELYKDTCRYTEGTKQQSDCFVANPITGGAWTYHQLSHQLVIHSKERYVNQGETQYLRVLRRVLQEGQKVTSRNATVYSLFGERMIFDLEQGFPLLTTKRMGYKTILRELLWFIQGSTDNKLLQEKRVHIWDQNASKEFLQSRDLPYEEGDLGPIYGFQWRHSGAEYKGCHENYGGKGYDQLQEVIRLLRDDPHSRRIVMSAWNPTDLDKMALPPCHVLCQFYVDDDNRLDCQLYQRSGDMFLGVPFNIASYACLTHILAKITGYKPGKLIHILGDAHIYESHIHQVRTQIERVPVRFPNIVLQDSLQTIDTLEEEMISIEGYQSYPSIKGSMVA
jgi:dihydrofolate reductase/thymidylate synthase